MSFRNFRGSLFVNTQLRQAEPELCDEVFDDVAVNVGQAEVSTGITVREFFVVEAEQFEHRRVQIVDVDFVFDRLETELVGRSVNVAALHAATGHPRCEAPVVVIATVDLAGV